MKWSVLPAVSGRKWRCWFPRGRHEVTTEGGLDIVAQEAKLKVAIDRLAQAGIVTSVFIDAELAQIEAAARIGARVCEICGRSHAPACRSGLHLNLRRFARGIGRNVTD